MTETTKVNYLDSKKKNSILPIVFLVVIIVITIALFMYNYYLQKQISDINAKTTEMNTTAEELQNRPEIEVYSILDSNASTIAELEKRSQVTAFMEHIDYISSKEKYDIRFEGFSLGRGEIATTAIVESNDKVAYEKAVNFIEGYRNDSEALFNLNFVNLVEGMDTMRFDLVFTIK